MPDNPDEGGAADGRAALLGPVEVRALAASLGVRPTKTLGQNFVHDANTVRRIVGRAGVRPDDVVVEVGPGLGSLTLALLDAAAAVVAVEIDPVLAGRLRTSSGYGAHRALDREVVTRGLREVVAGARRVAAVDRVAVHCCAPDVPLDLLRACEVDAVALDVSLLDERAWERVAEAVEAGTGLWAGLGAGAASVLADVEPLRRAWRGLGLPERTLDAVTLTGACGFAGRSFADARAEQARMVEAARALTDVALG